MGLLLYLVSLVLSLVLLPLGFLYGLASAFWRHRFRTGVRSVDRKCFHLAVAVDQYGGVVCAELLNATLIQQGSPHRFGRPEQTISAVVGLNVRSGHLTRTGRGLDKFLNFLDPGHSLKAAQPFLN